MSELQSALGKSLRRLSSGARINEARDDPAGLAVSIGLDSQVRGLRQVANNINQAFGYLQTAEGALATQTELVQRMRELALQAANGTLALDDRKMLNTELQALASEFDRVAKQANFNGANLLDGSFGTLNLQVGVNKGQSISFSLGASTLEQIFVDQRTVGTGTFDQSATGPAAAGATVAIREVLDIDADGNLDLVAISAADTRISFTDENGEISKTVTVAGVLSSQAFGDFNGDGKKDFVIRSGTDQLIYTYSEDQSFVQSQTLSNSEVASVYDFNNDGYDDLITNNWRVALNDGSGSFSAFGASVTLGGTGELVDINQDSILDILVRPSLGGGFATRLGSADGTFGSPTTQALGASYTSIVSGDVNGDGYLDVISPHASDGTIAIRLSSADGTFTAGTTFTLGAGFSNAIEPVDVNGDGFDDIAIRSSGSDEVVVRLSNGDGSFTHVSTIQLASVASQVGFSDVTGDGIVDLYEVNANQEINIGRGNGDGTFGDLVTSTHSHVWSQTFEFTDIDNDGNTDLALVPNNGSLTSAYSPTYYLGNGDGSFQTAITVGQPSGWNLGQYADFNQDGVADFVSGTASVGGEHGIFLQRTEIEEDPASLDISTQEGAQNLLEVFDRALERINQRRASIGAVQSRLESALNNTLLTTENLAAARSQILDLDIASEVAELTRLQILQQAQASVLQQANLSLQAVIALLRN
jgi:flagellin